MREIWNFFGLRKINWNKELKEISKSKVEKKKLGKELLDLYAIKFIYKLFIINWRMEGCNILDEEL